MDAERWQRLSPLLDALLELPAEMRSEHLAALRREDPALADELEALLALEDGDAEFLAEPIVDVPNGARPGARIGPYRLDGRAFLAPMAGVTDLPFRKIVMRLCAGLSVSEMFASQAILRRHLDPLEQNARRATGFQAHTRFGTPFHTSTASIQQEQRRTLAGLRRDDQLTGL